MHPNREEEPSEGIGDFAMKTLILKSLDACNLRCDYCSVGDKTASGMMTEPDMQRAMSFFAEQVQADGEGQIIFHGGEPTLLPAAQYDRCIRQLRRDFPALRFRLSMQTNGVLLTEEYLALFRTHDIHIGVSLDGGRAIHDGQRKDAAGNGSYERVMENIRSLQENDIPVAALMVVTRPALEAGLDFLDLLDEMDVPLKINPLLALGEAPRHPELALAPGDYSRYLIRVFEYAAEKDLSLHLSPLSELMAAILGNTRPAGCVYSPRCCRDFLCIDREGVIYPCGRFSDTHTHTLGTVESGITAEGEEILRRLEARRTAPVPEPCRDCRWLSMCHAGCSADHPEETSPCAICEDQKQLFQYLRTCGLKIMKSQLLKERARLLQLLKKGDGNEL